MNLSDIIEQGAINHPQRPALIYANSVTTYTELAQKVEHFAQELRRLGVLPGDRVALLLPNCPLFVVAYYAAVSIGAIVVPANPMLKPTELAYLWNDAGVSVVFTISALEPVVSIAKENVLTLQHVFAFPADIDPHTVSLAPTPPVSSLLERNETTREAEDENACAVILYTSGTTGFPKGAMLSHKNLCRNVEQVRAFLHFTSEDVFLTVLPLFHVFAATVCLHVCLSGGSACVLVPQFSPGAMFENIEKHKISIFCGVPSIFGAMLMHKSEREPDLSSLRFFVSGGAPLPGSTLQALESRFGVPVLEGDGPTECSPVTSVNPQHGVRKILSVGPALPGVEVKIFDDNDTELPPDEIGEIVVRGDNVMLGYLNRPEETAEAMKGGWYHTGDLGKIDEDGYIFIVDRKKDMVITGGLNVYPREVEEVLASHGAVGGCAVIGLLDALRGEEVVAVIVKKPGTEVTERELILFCRERLANYKVPRRVIFREVLPLGASGKVVKRLLKKELEQEI